MAVVPKINTSSIMSVSAHILYAGDTQLKMLMYDFYRLIDTKHIHHDIVLYI